jgi:signal transduction histidine kinase
MKRFTGKRKRIFFLFFLGIVLPSLLFGYLAFRGIKNDQALWEKNRLNEQRRLGELITRTIEASISAVEQDFQITLSSRDKISSLILIQDLNKFKLEHPLVEEVFVCKNFEKIQYPAAKLLYHLKGSLPPVPVGSQPSSLTNKVQAGQRWEFEHKDYKKALVSYEQTLDQVADGQMKAELLNAIARVQKKSALFEEAMKSYESIAQGFSQVRIGEGIPLGLAARFELGSLYLAVHDSPSSVKTFMDLYKSLVQKEWPLEETAYEFFIQNIKRSIEEIFSKASPDSPLKSYKSIFLALEKEEKKERGITERLLPFQAGAGPDLEANISGNLPPRIGSSTRFMLERGKYSYLGSLFRQRAENGQYADEMWGLLLNPDYLKNTLLYQALKRQDPAEEAPWIVRGKDGRAILSSEKAPSGAATIRAGFAGNVPNWSLEFYQPNPRLLKTFLASRQGIYFSMFLLIAGILIFGLVLTVRTVSHELDLARMKSDFVSTVSHEFKSPLTSIRQLAEMLQAGRVPSEERRRQYYDVLLEQSERLSLLIDNILNLAKIEEGRKEFEFEKLDIDVLLREVVSTIQDRVRHEGFVIEIKTESPSPEVRADRAALAQAITNLLDNAIKYSGEARKVMISSSVKDRTLVIAVKDFGIGIKKEEMNKVFERFYRGGDELTRSVKGSGLGLTLVKKIVEAHHGKVHVESEPGQGSTFSIMIPLP